MTYRTRSIGRLEQEGRVSGASRKGCAVGWEVVAGSCAGVESGASVQFWLHTPDNVLRMSCAADQSRWG